ncbi:MAG: TIGR03862 family flavoprotein [Alphaproteobacteria bacterium]|nr:TIGR03862 family flavoprotein [Alphaproteobacteria bacterium]
MSNQSFEPVAVIGTGPAGLMAAEVMARGGIDVVVYDRMSTPARKFLLAGLGGLNLTHSEPVAQFLQRYREAASRLEDPISRLSPDMLRAWSAELGEPTFVGSSGRVFPRSFKATPLLRAWLRRLDGEGVRLALGHRWTGWDGDGRLRFETGEGSRVVEAPAVVLALGGASWPRLGSDGAWTEILKSKGVAIAPLRPSNCGFTVAWSEVFRSRFQGAPLKGIALAFGAEVAKGEAVITETGMEGGAVYALSAPLREEIASAGRAVMKIALCPDLALDEIRARLAAPRGSQTLSNFLRKTLGLTPVKIGLLLEAAQLSGERLGVLLPDQLAERINAVPVTLNATAPLERAISSAGGICLDELDAGFMIRRLSGVFAAGEMLDWEAPTGGYLLQACFATGAAAGRGVLEWLKS